MSSVLCYCLFLNEPQVHKIRLIVTLGSQYVLSSLVPMLSSHLFVCLLSNKSPAYMKNKLVSLCHIIKYSKIQWLKITMTYVFMLRWFSNLPGLTWVGPAVCAGLAGCSKRASLNTGLQNGADCRLGLAVSGGWPGRVCLLR